MIKGPHILDKRIFILLLTAVYAVLSAAGGCRSGSVASIRVSGIPVVDGSDAEWTVPFTAAAGEKAELSLQNDEKDLYLCFRITDDGLRRRAAVGGLTVWFDRTGGRKKTFGVLFPYRESSVEPGDGPRREPPGGAVAAVLPSQIDGEHTMQLLAPGRIKPVTMAAAGTGKVTVAARSAGAMTVYELKVPLGVSGNGPFSVGADSAGIIGVGFGVSGSHISGRLRKPGQGGAGSGRRPPQRGGMGGPPMRGDGPGGPPPGRGAWNGGNEDGNEYWVTVKLAG